MGKLDNPSFSWFRDFWSCPWLPQPILFVFGDTRTLQIIQEIQKHFPTCYFANFKTLENWNHRFVWKDGDRQIRTTCLIHSWKSWIWDQHLPTTWNVCFWKSWISDQYLFKIHEMDSWNMGSIFFQKYEMEVWWYGSLSAKANNWLFETLKPRHQKNHEPKQLRNQEPRNQETKNPTQQQETKPKENKKLWSFEISLFN